MTLNIASHFVDAAAERWPERPAILGEPAAVSYAQLAGAVSQAGNALRRMGCRRGDRVLIVLPDSPEFVAAFFGAAKIGAVAVPVNPMTRQADYAYYLGDCSPRAVVVHNMALSEFLAASPRMQPELLLLAGCGAAEAPPGALHWERAVAGESRTLSAAATVPEDLAFFLYTSGTGGQPKAAMHRHADMLATTEGFAHKVMGIRQEDRTFSVSKLYFAYGLGNGMYFPFSVGASTIFLPERPRPERVFSIVREHRPTIFYSVPTFYAALLNEARRPGCAPCDFGSVRLCVSAGEALPAELFQQWNQYFGMEILDAIGSTEMLHMFISNLPGNCRPGSCGLPVPGCDAKIVEEDGTDVAGGEIGNLWVRGGAAFAGYYNKPELTARGKRGDWVVTGDKFFRDPEGFYHYCGRADDMLKVSGLWVAPTEVENALLGHPAVAEVAVASTLDENGLTKPLAFIVPRSDSIPGPDLAAEILAAVKARLPSYKCPAAVRFVAELPKTATGKIQRFRLRS